MTDSSEAAPPPASDFPPPPQLARGDLIWGKYRGFPWWPCELRSVRELKKAVPPNGKEHKVRVRFLHTKDNAEIGATSAVRSFAEHFDEFSVVKKGMFKSAGPRKKFEAAVAEAKERHESGKALEGPWSDDDAVDEEEVLEARAEASKHLDVWKTTGHDLIGKHVARYFGEADMRGGKSNGLKKRKAYLAVITRWLPAEDGDLFHRCTTTATRRTSTSTRHESRARSTIGSQTRNGCRRRERQQRADAKARMPKKPLSAYHLFGAAVRPELAISHPEMSPPEMLKVIAARWRELPETERQQYDVQAAEEVKRYVSECEAVGIDPGKAARLASGPEPALSALGFFAAARPRWALRSVACTGEVSAAEIGGLAPEIAALLQRSFDALPYEERDEIDDLAAIDQERFEEELAAYQAAAAKRRKTGHGGGGGGENDSAQPQQPPAKSSSSSSPPQQVMIKVKGLK